MNKFPLNGLGGLLVFVAVMVGIQYETGGT